MKNERLFQALTEAVPEDFLRGLLERHEHICREANAMVSTHPKLAEPEITYLRPHALRSIFEFEFRTLALDVGLPARTVTNKSKNYQYTMVEAGRFILTASQVPTPGTMVRSSRFREQLASLNLEEMIGQLLLAFPDRKGDVGRDNIFCVLLHGPSQENPDAAGFLRFAFPTSDSKRWVRSYPAQRILEAIIERSTPAITDEEIGIVLPWKKKIQEKEDK